MFLTNSFVMTLCMSAKDGVPASDRLQRSAFGITRVTPPRIRGVMKVLAVPGVRTAGGTDAFYLARRVRFLYRSTNQLKLELRRLQRVSGTFAR